MENSHNPSIIKVSADEWEVAQQYESHHMVFNNRKNGYLKLIYKFVKALKKPKRLWQYIKFRDFYCGDDWNYWWMEKFDNYRVLPKKMDKVLEVGSGPYTNVRLISRLADIKEIHCTDPLMHLYTAFRMNWIAQKVKEKGIIVSTSKAETIKYPDSTFDLVICNNVLDHVEDAGMCLNECVRVLRPGGHFIFGQDLTNEDDLKVESWRDDVGHPIKLHGDFLDKYFAQHYQDKLKKILPRPETRHPEQNYGTYIYIGAKK